jgi:predicted amidophosphoribosyltransferase
VLTLVDLLLPRPCPCGDPSGPACAACRSGLVPSTAKLVLAYPAPAGLPVCAAAAPYRGAVRRLLIAYKERGRRDLAGVLAVGLLHALLALPPVRAAFDPSARRLGGARRLVLVPVPASRAALRTRGVDHIVALIQGVLSPLRALGRPAGIEVSLAPMLEVTRRVADQAGLGASARAANLSGALRLRSADRLHPARARAAPAALVVVIDDVLTTGATMAEAVRALAFGGVRAHGAAVVATAVRHHPDGRRALFPRGERD